MEFVTDQQRTTETAADKQTSSLQDTYRDRYRLAWTTVEQLRPPETA